MAERDQFTIPLACPHCGAAGALVWEENSGPNIKGPQRRLVAIQGEFHQEPERVPAAEPVIVCNLCDQIQPD